MSNLELYKNKGFINLVPAKAVRDLRHIKCENSLMKSLKEQETPALSVLKKEHGEESLIKFVQLWIIDLNVSLNLKRPMSPEQVEECVYYIIDDYYYLTIADFKYFFSGIKKGAYGEMFESLSIAKLLNWLSDYSKKRMSKFEQDSIYSDQEYIDNKKESSKSIGDRSSKSQSIQDIKLQIDLKGESFRK